MSDNPDYYDDGTDWTPADGTLGVGATQRIQEEEDRREREDARRDARDND